MIFPFFLFLTHSVLKKMVCLAYPEENKCFRAEMQNNYRTVNKSIKYFYNLAGK